MKLFYQVDYLAEFWMFGGFEQLEQDHLNTTDTYTLGSHFIKGDLLVFQRS